jgi:hypothetical protein
MIESLWSTMLRELLDPQRWNTQQQLASAIFEALYTPPGGTPRSAITAQSSTKPFTPPPT